MNWYKCSWNRGIPIMDEYSEGRQPVSSGHKKDPRSLVNARPEFGGNKRPGYPKGISRNRDNNDTSEYEKIHGRIPGESVLMDQDPPTGEGVCHDEFVGEGEFTTNQSDDDRLPIKRRDRDLDNIDIGPHNMQIGDVFRRVKKHTGVKGLKL